MSRDASRRGLRRARTFAAALRQARLLRQVLNRGPGSPNSPNYFAKHHALNCGQPGCRLCMNPRHNPWCKGRGRLTRQELKAAAAERMERGSLGVVT